MLEDELAIRREGKGAVRREVQEGDDEECPTSAPAPLLG